MSQMILKVILLICTFHYSYIYFLYLCLIRMDNWFVTPPVGFYIIQHHHPQRSDKCASSRIMIYMSRLFSVLIVRFSLMQKKFLIQNVIIVININILIIIIIIDPPIPVDSLSGPRTGTRPTTPVAVLTVGTRTPSRSGVYVNVRYIESRFIIP